jgi:hydroxymethylbilane synthase
MQQLLKIATRKSPLALWQSEFVKSELLKKYPNLQIELVQMSTKGDEILDTSLSRIGGKGLFIKELEQGMLRGDADIAVHSLKDVPYVLPEKFELGAILEREEPSDAFVSNNYQSIDDLPIGAKVGTCSNRRIVQLKSLRPDLAILDLRGSVNTRLAKLDAKEYDAIILATAGLKRLGLESRITKKLNYYQSLPAVGQGAIAIEIRKGDKDTFNLIQTLAHKNTTLEVSAERAMNKKLAGNCSAPIAAFAKIKDDILNIKAMVGSVEQNIMLQASVSGDINDAEKLGASVADKLLSLGASDLLKYE